MVEKLTRAQLLVARLHEIESSECHSSRHQSEHWCKAYKRLAVDAITALEELVQWQRRHREAAEIDAVTMVELREELGLLSKKLETAGTDALEEYARELDRVFEFAQEAIAIGAVQFAGDFAKDVRRFAARWQVKT